MHQYQNFQFDFVADLFCFMLKDDIFYKSLFLLTFLREANNE